MKSSLTLLILLLFCLPWISVESSHAKTIYVSKQGSGVDGSSWEHALRRVSNAVDLSLSGDQIWIASGTYFESVIMKPALSLYGGFAGNETNTNQRNPSVYSTTIDGSTANTSVIFAATGTLLDSLRITGGNAIGGGGGLRCVNASMVLRSCKITANRAYTFDVPATGGGIYSVSSSVRIYDSEVSENIVNIVDSITHCAVYGGGIYMDGGLLLLDHCTISRNIAEFRTRDLPLPETGASSGGGIYLRGDLQCVSCLIEDNHAEGDFAGQLSAARGGGILSIGAVSIRESFITNNLARVGLNIEDIQFQGGGILVFGSLNVENTVFNDNDAIGGSINGFPVDSGGRSVFCEGDATLESCIVIAAPDSFGDIAGIRGKSGTTTIRNSITATLLRLSQIDFPSVTYSNILDGFPGEANINLDPQFVDPTNGDFRLLASSPCIDAGTTTGPVTDILGQTRPVDIPGVGRDGAGAFDMGAYEFQLSDLPTPTPTPTMTETPTITPTATATDTPTATPTPTRDPNASWIRKWDLYR